MVEEWEKDSRRDVVITDIDALVPKDHLLRKIEKVMDYGWIYERLEPYYTHVGRPPVDPVIIIKMAPLRRLYGNVSLRETWRRTDDSIAFRWFLEYNLFEKIPRLAFCNRFPSELTEEIFEHILNNGNQSVKKLNFNIFSAACTSEKSLLNGAHTGRRQVRN